MVESRPRHVQSGLVNTQCSPPCRCKTEQNPFPMSAMAGNRLDAKRRPQPTLHEEPCEVAKPNGAPSMPSAAADDDDGDDDDDDDDDDHEDDRDGDHDDDDDGDVDY